MFAIRDSLNGLLETNNMDYIEMVYEDLIVQPQACIDKLNAFLGSHLEVSDLEAVFRGQLGRRQLGGKDLVKAALIFLKNYRQRYG